MTLDGVLAVLARLGRPGTVVGGTTDVRVIGLSADSRAVVPGDLYAALPGAQHHGAAFSVEAATNGAVALLTDPDGLAAARTAGLPVVLVAEPRSVLGALAAAVHGHPDSRLLVLGVTGTNGKTTTTYLLDAGLRAAGHLTGLVGTVETRVGDEVVASVRTTPEAPDVQRLLARMVAAGCTAVSMEVSSHALALGRVDGTTFDVAQFTNLSQDHLDFHPTLEDYYAAKADLFSPDRSRHGVIDVDTPWGARLAAEATIPVTTVSSGLGLTGPDPAAHWRAVDIVLGPGGSTFVAEGPAGESFPVSLALPGPFNVANAIGAVATLAVAGVPAGDAAQGIAALAGVPGRMERIDAGQPYLALVDYAHTPDAVATLLSAVRASVTGPVVVVIGCGGDRDPHKRPAMGAAAVLGADVVILTSDNPRSEDPLEILAAMRAGAEEALTAHPTAELMVEPDRAEAIALAVRRSVPGGALVVAGKGHETGQEVAGVVRPFNDRDVLRSVIAP
jgi:UDP-N-acetylmuramoyl-L-alanyl-D-glutamate--2,6-diaminopimelate ligase